MGRKTKIAIVTGVVARSCSGPVAAYAYDSSQKDKIAEGVTIGGVDVGGMDAERSEARRAQASCSRPLRHSLEVGYDGESWKLPGKQLKVHADLDAAVEEALDASQRRRPAGPPGPLRHRRRGRRADPGRRHLLAAAPSTASSARSPRRSTANRRTPRSNASGDSLEVVPAEYGRKLRDNLLTDQINAAVLNADADHTIAARDPLDRSRR